MLTIVSKTRDTATEEWGWLTVALYTIAFVAKLIVQYVRFELNLEESKCNVIKIRILSYTEWYVYNYNSKQLQYLLLNGSKN